MKPEDNNSELRRAYQNLVETVEDLVVKEGKTLQQAMFFAEDKLSEWNELSKKQVQDISEELNHDYGDGVKHLSEIIATSAITPN